MSSKFKLDKLIGTPKWLLKDFEEEQVFPKFCSKSLIKFFKDVFPALPVTAIIFAKESSLLSFAKLFKNELEFLTFIIFLLFFFETLEEIIHPAPFLNATFINLFPSVFFPLIAKNKLPLLIVLVSIEKPIKLGNFFFLKILLSINLFCKYF